LVQRLLHLLIVGSRILHNILCEYL
jgi:hypothetical protein